MAHQLQTSDSKKLDALRKQVAEPVLGIIKSVLRSRTGMPAFNRRWFGPKVKFDSRTVMISLPPADAVVC